MTHWCVPLWPVCPTIFPHRWWHPGPCVGGPAQRAGSTPGSGTRGCAPSSSQVIRSCSQARPHYPPGRRAGLHTRPWALSPTPARCSHWPIPVHSFWQSYEAKSVHAHQAFFQEFEVRPRGSSGPEQGGPQAPRGPGPALEVGGISQLCTAPAPLLGWGQPPAPAPNLCRS